jgi:hypothetical protein
MQCWSLITGLRSHTSALSEVTRHSRDAESGATLPFFDFFLLFLGSGSPYVVQAGLDYIDSFYGRNLNFGIFLGYSA